MNRSKLLKKMAFLVLSITMLLNNSTNFFAAETINVPEKRGYLIVNGTQIVYEGEDYDNPETGEYIHWNTNARSIDKSFTFKIRYSVTSSNFNVSSSKVMVKVYASVCDAFGTPLDEYDDNHQYTVAIGGIFTRSMKCTINSTCTKTFSDLVAGGTYRVTITNNDYVDDYHYLIGNGTISPQ